MNGGPVRHDRGGVAAAVLIHVLLLLVGICPAPLPAAGAGLYDRGIEALKAGKNIKAEKILSEVLRSQPANVEALIGRGEALSHLFRYDEAIACFSEAMRLQPSDVRALILRCEAYVASNRLEQARADVEEAIRREPGNARYLAMRAELRLQAKDFRGSLDDANEAIRRQPDLPAGYWVRGKIYRATGLYGDSLADLDELVRRVPKEIESRRLRADLLYYVGRYADAEQEYRECLALSEEAETENALAWLLSTCPEKERLNGPEAVRLAASAAERTGWKQRSILDTLAAAHARSGDFASAVHWQKKALEQFTGGKRTVVDEVANRLEQYRQRKAYTEDPQDDPAHAWALKRHETFKQVWETVNRNYFDPVFGGVDWVGMKQRYGLQLHEVEDNAALRRLLRQMLGELNRTHIAILPREASVFSTAEQGRRGDIGAVVSVVQEQVVVRVVRPSSPAQEAGLRPGDLVEALNGTLLDDVRTSMAQAGVASSRIPMYLKDVVEGWFSGPVGTEIKLRVRGTNSERREVVAKCAPAVGEWSEPAGYCPAMPVEFELSRRENGICYVRFNAFALPAMRRFRAAVRSFHAGEALIIDLRNNRGGLGAMAAGICGLLSTQEFSLGSMRLRASRESLDVYPQAGAFSGPVAVLIDRASASTAEILAAGLRDAGRARLFGETTAGAALPSQFKSLPTDDILQYAVAEMSTPRGVVIEGNGVVPDAVVVMTQADCAAGCDPVLEAAVAWLQTQRESGVARLAHAQEAAR